MRNPEITPFEAALLVASATIMAGGMIMVVG